MTKTASIGDNSDAALRSYVDRIERLNEERQALGDDIKDIVAEAKAAGHNPKALRRIIAIRKRDKDEWRAEEDAVDAMLEKLGML